MIKRSASHETHDSSVASNHSDAPVSGVAAEKNKQGVELPLNKNTHYDALKMTLEEQVTPATSDENGEIITDMPLERNVVYPPGCHSPTDALEVYNEDKDDVDEDTELAGQTLGTELEQGDIVYPPRCAPMNASEKCQTLNTELEQSDVQKSGNKSFWRGWLFRKSKRKATTSTKTDSFRSTKKPTDRFSFLAKAQTVQRTNDDSEVGEISLNSFGPSEKERTKRKHRLFKLVSIKYNRQRKPVLVSHRKTPLMRCVVILFPQKRQKKTNEDITEGEDEEDDKDSAAALFLEELAETCFFFQCLAQCIGEEGKKLINEKDKETIVEGNGATPETEDENAVDQNDGSNIHE